VKHFVPAVEKGSLMSVDEYKAACQRPDAFTREALKETVRVLQAEAPELVPLVERGHHGTGKSLRRNG